ncbi:DNA primase [Lentilitoribacter sp. EG35]|uniref:DNA primase n=1 Tax=Lentilitoribacter sp. EG35 TaxID=3234192 RepID=UPI00345FD7E1
MRFSNSFLDEIRDRVPISDVIGRHVTWDRKKTNAPRGDYWACCPFHGEKSPSFHCEDKKGRYYCFGCGEKGDHFKFLTEYEGLNFVEAVSRLADQAGIALPAPDPEAAKRQEKRATLEDVMEMATSFFEMQLQESVGAKARSYLRDRGLSGRTISTFRLGFGPDSRNALKEHLSQKGIDKQLIEACGLVVHGPDIAVSYDRFRDRIMFPIPSSREKTIAFGGRAMDPSAPAKYLNSNETELFHKSNVLFNYARARKVIKNDDISIIAVEGYMDVIALHQAGIEHAVAPLGTALTENQLRLMWRVSSQPVLCFDGDGAGRRAAERAIDLALPHVSPGKSLRFAMLPVGKDPDDLVNEEGRSAFDAIIGNANSLADMVWNRETSTGVYDTPESKAELEKRFAQLTNTITDENIRRHYQQDIRDRLRGFFRSKFTNNTNFSNRRNQNSGRGKQAEANTNVGASDRLKRSGLVSGRSSLPALRESLLAYTIISHPHMLIDDFNMLSELEFENRELNELWKVMQEACADGSRLSRGEMISHLLQKSMNGMVEQLEKQMRQLRLWQALSDAAPEDAREGFLQAFSLQQRTRSLKKQKNELERDIASVTEEGDEASVPGLMSALNEIQIEIERLESQEAIIEGFGVLSGRGRTNS